MAKTPKTYIREKKTCSVSCPEKIGYPDVEN
jgi:hypothetical protein